MRIKLPKLPRLKALPVTAWQPLILYALFIAGLGSLLWYSLGTNTPGYSAAEAQTLSASSGWRTILDNPLNAPFTILTRLLLYLTENGLLATRLTATIFGAAALLVFYLLVRHWHGERTAVLGTILFASSAWFLHTARLGVPDVLFFNSLLLVAGLMWHKKTGSSLALLVCFALGAVLLYVPGMVWLVLIGVIWKWRIIDSAFKKHIWAAAAGALVLVSVLVPLGLAIYHDHNVAKELLGLPVQGWPQPLEVLKNAADVPLSLFWHAPENSERWLANVPILNYFAMTMFVLGSYVYVKHIGLDRARLIAIILLLGTALISLGGDVTISLLIPFVYILVASGTGFLLERWYTVFPRNRIAQLTSLTFVALAVAASVGYGLRHYFVAWPDAPGTRQTFTVQPVVSSVTIKK